MGKTAHQERGQILALVALLLPVLLGLVGLVVDTGHYFAERRQTQNAADHAAIAVAYVLFYGGTEAAARAAAVSYAEANGYDNDGVSNTVTVNIPPASGEHVGDSDYVEVFVEEDPTTFFIHVLLSAGTVRGRGVAGINYFPGDYALLVLDETSCEALRHEGTPNVTINDGSIMVNSNCPIDALDKDGSGNLIADGTIDIHGGYTITGPGAVSPAPDYVPWTVDDPLAGVTPPARGPATPCPTGPTGTAMAPRTCMIAGVTNRTISPGTYYGGLDFQCVCTVTLNPGIYIMSGGGFSKSGSAHLVGNGVMIYVTTNPDNPNGDGSPDPFNITGSGGLALTPITDPSSPYYGLGLWQDAAITSDFFFSGSATGFSGIIYSPGSLLELAGISSALSNVQIIADRARIRGTASLTIDYQEWREVLVPKVSLVE